MRNFGHKGQEDFWGLGINGKNSEFHAAMGLCVLPHVPEIISARKKISNWYDEKLDFSNLSRYVLPSGTRFNYGYFPVIFPSEAELLEVKKRMNAQNIFPRRYFYPSLENLPYISEQYCPVSECIARRILCLPLYYGLNEDQITKISQLINTQ
jgi:dTDP-4-amino-4,6-dideoxygalactose transaminase